MDQALCLYPNLKHIKLSNHTFHADAHDQKRKGPQEADEHKEVSVVFDTNAVINPRTMVVKSLNAMVADGTMS